MTKDTILTTNTDCEQRFLAIVKHIKSLYPEGKLSEPEAHQAARNLIEFVKIMLKYAEKKQQLTVKENS